MAEFLVRIVDQGQHPDPTIDSKISKAGDVVVCCPDGWQWGKSEVNAPFWMIVKVPGMSVSAGQAWCSTEPGDPMKNRVLQQRYFKFDFAGITGPLTEAQATIRISARPPMVDPAIIGPPVNIIG